MDSLCNYKYENIRSIKKNNMKKLIINSDVVNNCFNLETQYVKNQTSEPWDNIIYVLNIYFSLKF